MPSESKPLGSGDESGAAFVIEMLKGDSTFAINFDRIQWDSEYNGYIIVELLRTGESQTVNPYTSHPNRYFFKNARKFTSLWEIAQKLAAKLYLVNYAKLGTAHQDKILLMEVTNIDETNRRIPVKTFDQKFTRKEFSDWFRALNQRGSK